MSATQAQGVQFEGVRLRRGEFVFAPGNAALEHASVTVILGANGSGKTTALRLAAGLDRPDEGHVLVHGRAVLRLSPSDRARCLAYVPQRSVMGAPFTVRQVVALGRHALEDQPARVTAALELVRLSHRADEPFHRLSAGQQQRVVLARALAQHETGGVLVLDEVLAAIDPPETHHLVQVIRRLAADGATVLMATHDLSLAAALADYAWYLAHGSTAALGPAAVVLEPASLSALASVPIAAAPGARGMLPVPDHTAMLRHES